MKHFIVYACNCLTIFNYHFRFYFCLIHTSSFHHEVRKHWGGTKISASCFSSSCCKWHKIKWNYTICYSITTTRRFDFRQFFAWNKQSFSKQLWMVMKGRKRNTVQPQFILCQRHTNLDSILHKSVDKIHSCINIDMLFMYV